ncbi:MAG TPA: ABC transporter permease, partial [Reyranella sp.]|nr:ABC transporter permease [Reyranella sp.]
MKPLVPVTLERRIVLGVAFFVGFVALWFLLTWSGAVPHVFLASPLQTLLSGWNLFATQKFGFDVGMTIWRVVGGFLMAAVIAVPLGIAMGAYKPIEAFFEPFVSFARYLPASAFIPLLILWVGIGEAQKLTVIFIGCFFQLTLMVTMIVSGTRRDLVEAAYTLGCTDIGVVRRVLLPGAAPEIADWSAPASKIAEELGLSAAEVLSALQVGCQQGKLMFDVAREVYRHRPLTGEPLDAARFEFRNVRERRAHDLC